MPIRVALPDSVFHLVDTAKEEGRKRGVDPSVIVLAYLSVNLEFVGSAVDEISDRLRALEERQS